VVFKTSLNKATIQLCPPTFAQNPLFMYLNRLLKSSLLLLTLLTATTFRVMAQTPSDAVMMKSGEICFGLNYGNSAWSEYWEGDSLRENGNIGTLTTQSITGGFMLGILDRVNMIAMLPYVITDPSGGVVAGDKGIQDAAIFVKGLIYEHKAGPGNIKFLASAGLLLPASDYVPEHPFAIGLGCPDGIFRGIIHYDADMGLYGRVDGAFHLRGNAILDRNYYYTTSGYYSDEVDMPDAMDYNATIGYIFPSKHFKVEGVLNGFNTFGGFDIRRQDGGFPSNDMEAMRVGLNADYYDLLVKGLAVHFNSNYTLTGRNVGKSMMFGGGISYQFGLWGKKDKAQSSSPTPQAN
jgi:hypothetical protein